MFLYVDEKKTFYLDDILMLKKNRAKRSKKKTTIILKTGQEYNTNRTIKLLKKRVFSEKGFVLKEY